MLKTIEKYVKKSGLAFRNGYEYVSYGKFGNGEREIADLDKRYLLDTENLQFELSFKFTDSFTAKFAVKDFLGKAAKIDFLDLMGLVDTEFGNKNKYEVAIAVSNKEFFENVVKAIIPITKTIIETACANIEYDLLENDNEI